MGGTGREGSVVGGCSIRGFRLLSGRRVTSNVFSVEMGGSRLTPLTGYKRFTRICIPSGALHEPVSIYSDRGNILHLICRMGNRKAGVVSRVGGNRDISVLTPLNGNFGVRGNGHCYLVNNNVNIPPVLCATGRYRGPLIVANFEGGSLVVLRSSFGGTNTRLILAASSKDTKVRNFMASILGRGVSRISRIYTYNPAPVLGTVTSIYGRTKGPYRVSLRREVTYKVNTYLIYTMGMEGGNRRVVRRIYGGNPMFGTRRMIFGN